MNGVGELLHELGEARRAIDRLKTQARSAGCEVPDEVNDLVAAAVRAVNGCFDRIEQPGLLLEAWSAVFRLQNTIARVHVEVDRARGLMARAAVLRHRAAELVAESRDELAGGRDLLRRRVSITVVGAAPPDLPVWETVARVTFARMTRLSVVLRQDGDAWSVDEARERGDATSEIVADWRPHLEAAFAAAGLAVIRRT